MEVVALRSHSPSPWKGQESMQQEMMNGHSPDFSQRSASKRGHSVGMAAARNFLSRSVRARRRGAFLKTYTLSSLDNSSAAPLPKRSRARRAAAKIKSVLVSAVEAVRNSSNRLRGCTSRSAICPSSSIQLRKD